MSIAKGVRRFCLLCKKKELQLDGTLNGGQSFRWKNLAPKQWLGIFDGKVWILEQNDDQIDYDVYPVDDLQKESYYNGILWRYFRLDLNAEENFRLWSEKDGIFQKASIQFYGIRIMDQDIVENVFSFICSSNNNISRITKMVEKLAMLFGDKICSLNGQSYHAFPTIEALTNPDVEQILKREGFGYRAKYISQSAQAIQSYGGLDWLIGLKRMSYNEGRGQLMRLTGIGPKVADCICLMSLGHLEAIPVDTHVYQIARNFYIKSLPKRKSVTTKIYQEIGDFFRKLYGNKAGWAHTVLFCADLKKFQNIESS